MNYLAHAFLAGPLATDRIGGVIGDFVKGPLPAGLDEALAAGVAQHRRIDSFADSHPAFRRSRARISDGRRRVSGVMVDMFYAHFLALHWQHFSPRPLTLSMKSPRCVSLPPRASAPTLFMNSPTCSERLDF